MAREMKDSGIEWIGQIPNSWGINKIKHNFSIVSGATPKSENADYWDGDILWITPADFKTQDKYVVRGKRNISQAGYDSCGTTLVPENSVIFSKRAPVGTVAIAKTALCTNQGCLSCIPKKKTSSLFYYYAMSIFTEQFELVSTGTTFKEIAATVFSDFYLPHPSIEEQQRIAAFLDSECSRIDSVIEQTRASIEEYKKLKQAVITQAVTKGIRPERKMKNSGVEWIGSINRDYELVKLKHVLQKQLQYGANQAGISYDSSLPRYIRITDITTDGRLKESGALSLTEKDSEGYILQNNDVLFARSGATVGKAFIYKEEYGRSAFAGYLIRATLSKKLLPDLLFYYTQSSIYEEWKSQIFIQATIQNIGADRYREMPIILQPINEQEELIEYLTEKCNEIDSIIGRKETLIVVLEAYKKSLIFEYVTGKKEVTA